MANSRKKSKHVTIIDIAERAHVSTSAVSYALNGRPGVSDATRRKILALADTMGWQPNSAARALQASRANAVGVILAGDGSTLGGTTDYLLRFLSGVESGLSAHDILLVLHTVRDLTAEMAMYRRWHGERRVDGVIVVNPTVEDPRFDFLKALNMPAVVAGDTRDLDGPPSVWTDDIRSTRMAIEYLTSLGHRRIARVGTRPEYLHSRIRKDAFAKTMVGAGLEPDLSVDIRDADDAGRATRNLLKRHDPPTAVMYEGDSVALQAAATVREMGVRVPDELSILTWDDSQLCQLVSPALTALRRDVFGYGRKTSQHLIDLLDDSSVTSIQGAVTELVVRASTAGPA